MKVLGISCSPRNEGNTDHAVRAALKIIEDEGPDAEVEFLRMADYSLEHCKGCRHCMTHVKCAIEGDDLGLLVGKMHTSDPNILGVPVY